MFVGGLPSELDGFRTFVTFVTFQQLWLRPIDPGSIIGDRNTGKFENGEYFQPFPVGLSHGDTSPVGANTALRQIAGAKNAFC